MHDYQSLIHLVLRFRKEQANNLIQLYSENLKVPLSFLLLEVDWLCNLVSTSWTWIRPFHPSVRWGWPCCCWRRLAWTPSHESLQIKSLKTENGTMLKLESVHSKLPRSKKINHEAQYWNQETGGRKQDDEPFPYVPFEPFWASLSSPCTREQPVESAWAIHWIWRKHVRDAEYIIYIIKKIHYILYSICCWSVVYDDGKRNKYMSYHEAIFVQRLCLQNTWLHYSESKNSAK